MTTFSRRQVLGAAALGASLAACARPVTSTFTSATAKTIILGHLEPQRFAIGVVVVCLGTVLAQHAYRDGGLGAPLAVLTLLDPFTAGSLGMLVLGEPFGTTPIRLALGVAGGLVTCVGVGLLSTRPTATPAPRHPAPIG